MDRDGPRRLRCGCAAIRRPHAARDADRRCGPAPSARPAGERWFLPGKFRFCPACGDQPAVQAREINKLASLSAEGRSSATTLLVSSALRWMNASRQRHYRPDKRKLLGFTDNRQDAALQAGHFNDFLFVALLRAATLAAVRAAGPEGLSEDEFGRRVQRHAGFQGAKRERRKEWMLDPEMQGRRLRSMPSDAGARAGAPRLGRPAARLAVHQSRTWRSWAWSAPTMFRSMIWPLMTTHLPTPRPSFARASARRSERKALRILLDHLRQGLADHDRSPGPANVEAIGNAIAAEPARAVVDLAAGEPARGGGADHRCPEARKTRGVRGETLIVRGGAAQPCWRATLVRAEHLGQAASSARPISRSSSALLAAAAEYGLVRSVATASTLTGWRLAANAVRLVASGRPCRRQAANPYFAELLSHARRCACERRRRLVRPRGPRAHRAGGSGRREWREWRFRWGDEDRDESRREEGGDAPCRGAQRLPAGAVLLADDGARRRHLGAQRRLPAQHAADAGQLRAALRARRALRPGGTGRHLLRRAEPARPVLLRAAAARW